MIHDWRKTKSQWLKSRNEWSKSFKYDPEISLPRFLANDFAHTKVIKWIFIQEILEFRQNEAIPKILVIQRLDSNLIIAASQVKSIDDCNQLLLANCE